MEAPGPRTTTAVVSSSCPYPGKGSHKNQLMDGCADLFLQIAERNYPQSNTPVTMPPAYLQQQAWNMYPMYYSQSSAL